MKRNEYLIVLLAALALALPAMAQAPASAPASAASIQAAPTPPARAEWVVENADASRKASIGSLDKKNTGYLIQADLIGNGASVFTLKLADYFTTVHDKELYKKLHADEAAYQATVAKDPAKYHGHYSLLNPVIFSQHENFPLETRAVKIQGPGIDVKFSIDQGGRDLQFWNIKPQPASASADSQSVSLTWTLWRDANFADATKPSKPEQFLRLTKTYTLKKDSYSIEMSLKVENLSQLPLTVSIEQAGPTGLPEEINARQDSREVVAGKFNFTDQKIDLKIAKADAFKNTPLYQDWWLGTSADGWTWLGETNKYFGSMMYLASPKPEQLTAIDYRAGFYWQPINETDTSKTWATGIYLPAIELKPGSSQTVNFDIYAGPKDRDLLSADKLPGKALYKDLNYIGIIDLSGGGCTWCTFSWLTFGMMWMLDKLAWLSFGNYGIAIIILVIMVRLALHPLTKKGQVSMMKMQKLGPAMAKIKEKYANDKEALNREMMAAYKEQGATPILGCLPMFLQMPIWIALWTALSNSVELRHAAFLPVWITDLAAPDALISWPTAVNVPLISMMVGPIHSLNLLPLLLTVAMFLQTKLTPTAAPATPDAAKQQKMMMYMMPLMMLMIFYSAPSGLTLYIMASTFAGVAEQYVIKRHIKQKEAEEALATQFVNIPGRGARNARLKKPKGPFWTKH